MELTYETLRRNKFTDAYIRPLVLCSPNMSFRKAGNVISLLKHGNGPTGTWATRWTSWLPLTVARRCFHVDAKVSGHYVNSSSPAAKTKALWQKAAVPISLWKRRRTVYEPKGNILPELQGLLFLNYAEELNIPVEENSLPGRNAWRWCRLLSGTTKVVALSSLDNVLI